MELKTKLGFKTRMSVGPKKVKKNKSYTNAKSHVKWHKDMPLFQQYMPVVVLSLPPTHCLLIPPSPLLTLPPGCHILWTM